MIVTHLPAIYGLALINPDVHEAEHGLYLLTSLLVWAPLIGVGPVPHRPGPRGRFAWMGACMLPMVAIAVWLGTAPDAVYSHYLHALGAHALADQHLGRNDHVGRRTPRVPRTAPGTKTDVRPDHAAPISTPAALAANSAHSGRPLEGTPACL